MDKTIEKGGWEKHYICDFELLFEINNEVATFSITGESSLMSNSINEFSNELQELIVKYTQGESNE